jgi:16S rRNA (guanine(1405)-N(7))-methyltransferase
MKELVKKIKSKKELKHLDDDFVIKLLRQKQIKTHNKRSKEYKALLKEMRKDLRDVYGVFILKNYDKKELWLKEGKIDEILRLHKSTKERFGYYKEVYDRIFSITGFPKKILDLGCGLNPLSYKYLNCKPYYIASDISKEDLLFIEKFFKEYKIKGRTIKADLTEKIPDVKVDVCFMFKLLDSLETLKLNITKKLLRKIKAKYIIVSFPTMSIGGKKEMHERKWFEELISDATKFTIPNEVFYIIKN